MTDGESGESMEERTFMGRGESETEILELLRALQKTSYHAARRYAPADSGGSTSVCGRSAIRTALEAWPRHCMPSWPRHLGQVGQTDGWIAASLNTPLQQAAY